MHCRIYVILCVLEINKKTIIDCCDVGLKGDHVSECELKRSKPASNICWHPVKKILAVGWETGEISMWNQTDRELNDVFPLHKSEISILRFTSSGSRLVSGDTVGLVQLLHVYLVRT